jgi:hypothetical protein
MGAEFRDASGKHRLAERTVADGNRQHGDPREQIVKHGDSPGGLIRIDLDAVTDFSFQILVPLKPLRFPAGANPFNDLLDGDIRVGLFQFLNNLPNLFLIKRNAHGFPFPWASVAAFAAVSSVRRRRRKYESVSRSLKTI